MTSYYGMPMTVNKYTSFHVHQTDEIRQLLSWNRCIFSLTADALHCSSKFGLPLYHHQSVSFRYVVLLMARSDSHGNL